MARDGWGQQWHGCYWEVEQKPMYRPIPNPRPLSHRPFCQLSTGSYTTTIVVAIVTPRCFVPGARYARRERTPNHQ
ncbi:hypothetical protein CC2G_006287 [Coprinopsis cinerea AmutBmut pab1-1]|nr:hypothetical protein CC2G_006287 [Coprinopsis cinerea AmutBmut pab1-1]